MELHSSGIKLSQKLSTRQVSLDASTVIVLGKSDADNVETINNLLFNHTSISTVHAQFNILTFVIVAVLVEQWSIQINCIQLVMLPNL